MSTLPVTRPTPRPAPGRRQPGGRRDWLVLLCVLLAVGIYVTVWVHYVTVHTVDRFVAAAPGAPATVDGQSLRVVSLVRTTTLTSDNEGAEPQVAPAGAEYVVARVELTSDRAVEYGNCNLWLLGPQERIWEKAITDVSRGTSGLCSDPQVGSTELEFVYEVPVAYADQLYGLALIDHAVVDPAVVLTPAR